MKEKSQYKDTSRETATAMVRGIFGVVNGYIKKKKRS